MLAVFLHRSSETCLKHARVCLWCVVTLASWSIASISLGQHADVEIEVEGGQLVTDPRVAEGEFGEAPNPANLATEPGIEADAGALVPGDDVGFNVVPLDIGGEVRNLWYWDGAGAVNFVASAHSLSINHPLVVPFTITLDSNLGAGTVAGFQIGEADGTGFFHQDLHMVLGTATPDDGVYLFGMEMTSPQYLTSDPVYFVMASNVDESIHEAAVDFVIDHFMVPEPGTMSAGLLGVFTIACLRLRNVRLSVPQS
jgi:hypothetical protein